ncbi:MAG: guanine nucleotide exchange factor [Candidatus Pacebacteria bacterium]|nr:guanine nucleotide exchange factor [Candidatus Paceibacterota bacterium]
MRIEALENEIQGLLYQPGVLITVRPETRYALAKALRAASQTVLPVLEESKTPVPLGFPLEIQRRKKPAAGEEKEPPDSPSSLGSSSGVSLEAAKSLGRSGGEGIMRSYLSPKAIGDSGKGKTRRAVQIPGEEEEAKESPEDIAAECRKEIMKIVEENKRNYQYALPETPDYVQYISEEDAPKLRHINIVGEKGTLHGATFDKLVEWIGGQRSLEFRDLVINTYENYTTSCNLLLALIRRFMIPWPLNLSAKEAVAVLDGRIKVIQTKILGFLQYWITERKEDFHYPRLKLLMQTWLTYVKEDKVYNRLNKRQIETQIVPVLDRATDVNFQRKLKRNAANFDPQEIVLPNKMVSYDNLISGCGLLDFSSEVVAMQLAIIDQKYFCGITAGDLLNIINYGKNNPTKARLIERFNNFTSFVTAYIIKEVTPESRESLVEKFFEIAERSMKIGNLNAAFSIYTSFSAYISRLKRTWARPMTRHREFMHELERIFLTDGSYANLHEFTKTLEPPCVPCFQIWAKDMDTISEMYKNDYLPDGRKEVQEERPRLINMRRQAVIADRTKDLILYQKVKYKYYKLPMLYTFLDEDYKHSLLSLVQRIDASENSQHFDSIISRLE